MMVMMSKRVLRPILLLLAVTYGYRLSTQPTTKRTKTLKIRMFWVRHGLSCANVLQTKCISDPAQIRELFQEKRPGLEASLRRHFALKGATNGGAQEESRVGHNFSQEAMLDDDYKLHSTGPDMFRGYQEIHNEAADPSKTPGVCTALIKRFPGDEGLHPWMGRKSQECATSCEAADCCGGIIPLHGLYQDPLLTDCAGHQSQWAGVQLLKHLAAIGHPKLELVASSFLMRAMETAYNMFFVGPGSDERLKALVPPALTPVPYMIEKHHGEHGFVQMDNIPFPSEAQMQALVARHGENLTHLLDFSQSRGYPREEQHWEKFKALLAMELAPKLRPELLEPRLEKPDPREAFETQLEQESHAGHRGKMAGGLSWKQGTTQESYKLGEDFTLEEYKSFEGAEPLTELNIALVGHSQTMLEYCFREKPNNNGVYEKLFILEVSTEPGSNQQEFVMRELASNGVTLQSGEKVGCRSIMEVPAQTNKIEPRDAAVCAKGFWDSNPFLHFDQENTGEGVTVCEKPYTDASKFAFPWQDPQKK